MVHHAHAAPPQGFDDALAMRVLDGALAAGAVVYGISGLQGSGKSTLAAQVVAAATGRGLRAVALSLDDVYLDVPARRALARDVHPLLATRGPPGTHDLPLALATLDALRAGRRTRLPRFDKLGDRRLPRSQWPLVGPVDLVVFEGWCLCTPPEPAAGLVEPVNTLEREHDAGGAWRGYCNAALARDYPALWERVDRLLFLQPPGFEVVASWRWQQEQALQAGSPTRPAMTRSQVTRFVQHFERVSRQALRILPAQADAVIELDAARRTVGCRGLA
ncbi:kinase [Luteimonas sp. SDU82]|uniref:kinase n=1 Tax=Luteimonas sp. SDU82 TaxID=3422592 RepID=UPI003EBB688D